MRRYLFLIYKFLKQDEMIGHDRVTWGGFSATKDPKKNG
jgi:hypothetical protein